VALGAAQPLSQTPAVQKQLEMFPQQTICKQSFPHDPQFARSFWRSTQVAVPLRE
jgi:hypothetical protein